MRPPRPKTLTWLGLALAAAALAGCADETPVAPAPAVSFDALTDVITVTTTDESGSGSLGEALGAATNGTTITFDPSIAGQTIALSQHVTIPADLTVTIEGPADKGITLDAGGNDVVLMVVAGATATLRNLTIMGGTNTLGGGIHNEGDLTLENCTVAGNQAPPGVNESGSGGGIYSLGPLTLVNSTVSGNDGYEGGGIFYGDPGSALSLDNSTVVDNDGGYGGGLAVRDSKAFRLRNSIVANNTAEKLVTNNCYIESASTSVTLSGVNLTNAGVTECYQDDPHPNYIYADPIELGPLADNGGPTWTHALPKGSPAIDAATDCDTDTDQRYVSRPQGAACDIGAYEFDSYVQPTNSINRTTSVDPNTGAAVVTGTLTCPVPGLFDLTVSLTQDQKTRRVEDQVVSSDHVLVDCDGSQRWGIVLSPASGAFRNGSGFATAESAPDYADYILGSQAQGTVKMYWGHK